MKRAKLYLFLLLIFTLGCGEENAYEIQNLKDGEFIVKLYNSKGHLLLTTKGDAENFNTSGNYWEIRFVDPTLERFASLTVIGQTPINKPQEFQLDSNNVAIFHQRWYSSQDVWGYKSTNGSLNITSWKESKVKGSFEINLDVDPNAQQNPLWGEHILAKGYFTSICPYEDVGVCP